MTYSGIGSRETPPDILSKIEQIASYFASLGWILRSGAADGADYAFEKGCDKNNGRKEIYLPWRGFNGHPSRLLYTEDAREMASMIHPGWMWLKDGARSLHARNCHQVLGWDLKTPSDFVVCWTQDGAFRGGTATALTIARKNNIPIFNLGINGDLEKLRSWVKKCKNMS